MEVLDSGRTRGALLLDLSKDFDFIFYGLLLAKLSAYGFDYNQLKLINSFLSDGKFRTQIVSFYNPCLNLDLLAGVYQGSIQSTLILNIYICNIFQCNCKSNIDTTFYVCERKTDLVLSKLEKGAFTVFTQFQNNYLKANSQKSHLLSTSDNVGQANGWVGAKLTYQQQKWRNIRLLGILIDQKLTFENHHTNIF